MATQHEEERIYVPKDAISATLRTTAITGGVGLFASAVQNTLVRQNVGPWGVFTRSGGTIGIFAAMGGTFEFVRTASANLREKDDTYNVALGGFFAGAVIGLKSRTFPAVLGYGAACAVVMGAFDYTGGSLFGYKKDNEEDKFEQLSKLRTRYRTPAEETITELGEGRGIYGPGYAERRRERIKQAYGIDVPNTPPPAS